MLAGVLTGAVRGVEAFSVRVEVHICSGLPAFGVVGLAQGSVREGRERVSAALRMSGFGLPNRRITVNLAPADVRKQGTAFDLPIAVGILAAAGDVPVESLERTAFLGELGLGGRLRSVPAVLPVVVACRDAGAESVVVPQANAREAALVHGMRTYGAQDLTAVVAHLTGRRTLEAGRADPDTVHACSEDPGPDLADVRGQGAAKRALEVAAAGAHNLLMVGPPGAGKTMLARRLPGILPPLSLDEALDVTRIHSVAGLLRGEGLIRRRPFRAPHHSVSYAGLVGGGSPIRPGEISLAHHGVLFLDELGEYRRDVLEVLRQPVEEGVVSLARARDTVRFPARVLLLAAMNPCPCGHAGDGTDRCLCDPGHIRRYQGRISGPLLDRIDLHVPVPSVPLASLDRREGDTSAAVAERVAAARRLQADRFQNSGALRCNAHMSSKELRLHRPPRTVVRFLQRAVDGLGLSARAYHRVLKVARTIADLDGDEDVAERHAAEAVQYRLLDRVGG